MTQPSDMGLTPQQLLQMAQQYSAQDQAAPPQIDPAAGMAHSAPQQSPAQYFAAQPMSAPAAPAAPTRIPFPQGAASGASPAGGVANPSLALLPGGGARPAGWNPNDRKTDVTRAPYSPDTIGAKGDVLGSTAGQIGAQSDYDAVKAQATNQAAQTLGLFNEATSAQDRLRSQHQLNELHDYHRKIEGVVQDAAQDKVDPMKWFSKDMNTGQKIMFALGSALQGFGYGYTGRGVNPAENIARMSEQSVASQRAAHEGKLQTVQGMQSQYGRMKELFGDDESASKALQAAQLTAITGHLDSAIADQSTPYAGKLQAANIKLQLDQKRADLLAELDEHNVGKISTSTSDKYAPATAGGVGAVGVTVTLADGTRKVIPIDTAKELNLLSKDQLEAQKTAAETRKTIADADAAEAKAAGAKPGAATKQLAETAKNVESVAYDPMRYIQGTDAYKQHLQNEDYKAQLITAWHRANPGIRLTPEMIKEGLGAYMPADGDTASTIQQKLHLGLASIGGGQASVDAGSGAEEQ